MVFTDELVDYLEAFAAGVPVDEVTLALEEIEAVGPRGSHLARRYTRQHVRDYRTASLLDQWPHDHWRADGALDLIARLGTGSRSCAPRRPPFSLSDVAEATIEAALAATAAARAS